MCYVTAGSSCRRLVRQLLDVGPGKARKLLNLKPHVLLGKCHQRGMQSYQFGLSEIFQVHHGNAAWKRLTMHRSAPVVSCLNTSGWDSAREEACHFSFLPLDRSGEHRNNVDVYLKSDKAKVVVFVDGMTALVQYQHSTAHMSFWLGGEGRVPVDAEGGDVGLVPFVVNACDELIRGCDEEDPGNVFLGIWKGDNETPVFVRDVGRLSEEFLNAQGIVLMNARSAGPKVCAEDSSLLALSNGILQWHKNSKFCPKTGQEASDIILGGHGRRVPAVEGTRVRAIYPRIDPAVIVVAMHGEWFLLGRKASWELGRYSLLAGFVELGETFEDASVREVYEESGVKLCLQSLEYQRSQPWPFPQSLMVGFKGETKDFVNAASGFDLLSKDGQNAAKHVGILEQEIDMYRSHLTLPHVSVDEDELEDARFFHSSWLRQQLQSSNEFRIPGKHALANKLIHQHLSELPDGGECPQLLCIPEIAIPLESSNQMKYVLLRVSLVSSDGSWKSKLIVRGDPRAAYHNHVFTAAKSELALVDTANSLHLDVLGGGRIQVDATDNSISVFGFSAAFGQAPHEITGSILRAALPFYSIHVSYEGY